MKLATAQGAPALAPRGTADIYVGLSELHRERNDLDTASERLLRGKALGEHTGFPQNRYRWPMAMAQLRVAQGDLDGALDLLEDAERLFSSAFSPDVRPIPAMKARVWIAQRRSDEALAWAREHHLSPDDDLTYPREFEHITLARLFLARKQDDGAGHPLGEATGLLERLLKAAEEGGRTGSVIEILALLALTHQMQGNTRAALAPLHHALSLAEPEGYVRIFLDEGPPMALLLETAAKHGTASRYVHQFKPGDEVFGDVFRHHYGGFAEYVAVLENILALKPANLSFSASFHSPLAPTA